MSGAREVAGLAQVKWQRRQSIDAVSAVPQAERLTAPDSSIRDQRWSKETSEGT